MLSNLSSAEAPAGYANKSEQARRLLPCPARAFVFFLSASLRHQVASAEETGGESAEQQNWKYRSLFQFWVDWYWEAQSNFAKKLVFLL